MQSMSEILGLSTIIRLSGAAMDLTLVLFDIR
jgi:hypothetical protein